MFHFFSRQKKPLRQVQFPLPKTTVFYYNATMTLHLVLPQNCQARVWIEEKHFWCEPPRFHYAPIAQHMLQIQHMPLLKLLFYKRGEEVFFVWKRFCRQFFPIWIQSYLPLVFQSCQPVSKWLLVE